MRRRITFFRVNNQILVSDVNNWRLTRKKNWISTHVIFPRTAVGVVISVDAPPKIFTRFYMTTRPHNTWQKWGPTQVSDTDFRQVSIGFYIGGCRWCSHVMDTRFVFLVISIFLLQRSQQRHCLRRRQRRPGSQVVWLDVYLSKTVMYIYINLRFLKPRSRWNNFTAFYVSIFSLCLFIRNEK